MFRLDNETSKNQPRSGGTAVSPGREPWVTSPKRPESLQGRHNHHRLDRGEARKLRPSRSCRSGTPAENPKAVTTSGAASHIELSQSAFIIRCFWLPSVVTKDFLPDRMR